MQIKQQHNTSNGTPIAIGNMIANDIPPSLDSVNGDAGGIGGGDSGGGE